MDKTKYLYIKKVWDLLIPGDILYNFPDISSELFVTVLDKSKKGLILSALSNNPTIISEFNSPFKWSEKKGCIIDKNGNPVELFSKSFCVMKGVETKTADRYQERLNDIIQISEKKFNKIIAKNGETFLKIREAILNPALADKPQKMSAILNEVFGVGNYTEKQLILMTVIQIHFEKEIEKIQRDAKKTINDTIRDIQMQDIMINHPGFPV